MAQPDTSHDEKRAARRTVRRFRSWVGGCLARLTLSGAVTLSLVTLAVTGLFTLWLTNVLGNHHWHWGLSIAPMPWDQRLKYAAAIVTGCGATVALVVNYRKQRDTEQGRFATSFADACAQLGGEAPAVRLGGVYALTALADRQSDPARRQQCIDALCAYLRLPYSPTAGKDHTTTKTTETTSGNAKTVVTSSYRPADKEVRLTIIRLIRDHLQDPTATTTWVGYDLDFTGAIFDGGDFTGAHFTSTTSFDAARFSAGQVSFDRTVFSDGLVSFEGAVFSDCLVSFKRAKFAGGQVSLRRARFSAGQVSFDRTVFSGGLVSFVSATFAGALVSFANAAFSAGQVSFAAAKFLRGRVSFAAAEFVGGQVSFPAAEFGGGQVSFPGAKFLRGQVSFGGAVFSDGQMLFPTTKFLGSRVWFDLTVFAGGQVLFDSAVFSAGQVSFDSTKFSGGQVLFNRAVWTGGEVSFDNADFSDETAEFDGHQFDAERAAYAVQLDGKPFFDRA